MGPPTTRLEDDDLVKVPDVYADFFEILRCGICCHFDTSWKMLPCSHIYCACCIDKILEMPSPSCPECRTKFRKQSVLAARERNNISATLAVKCTREGRDNGCGWQGRFDSRKGHLAKCEFQPAKCPHVGCTAKSLIRKKLLFHEINCDFRIVNCCHSGCPTTFLKKQKNKKMDHEKRCGKRLVPCELCKKILWKEELLSHVAKFCNEAVVTCARELENESGSYMENPRKRGRAEFEAVVRTCKWAGKRRQLSDHRKECAAYAMCTQMLPYLFGTITKQSDEIKMLKKKAS
eukprot:Rmarinus@m.21400